MRGEGILLPALSTKVTTYVMQSELCTFGNHELLKGSVLWFFYSLIFWGLSSKYLLLVQIIAKYDRVQCNSEQELWMNFQQTVTCILTRQIWNKFQFFSLIIYLFYNYQTRSIHYKSESWYLSLDCWAHLGVIVNYIQFTFGVVI